MRAPIKQLGNIVVDHPVSPATGVMPQCRSNIPFSNAGASCDKNAYGEMADDDFQEVKKLTKGRIEKLEKQLNNLAIVGTEIKDLVASALKKVANIDRRYENGDIEEKREIIGSIFPENLLFDGEEHRTTKLNSVITLIYQKTK